MLTATTRIIFSLFISGAALGSGPCLASCGPVLVSYIAAAKRSPKQGFWVWLWFSLARVCVYVVLSVFIFFAGEFLVKQKLSYIAKYVFLAGGITIVLIGILAALKDSVGSLGCCSAVFKRLNQRVSKFHPVTLGLIMGALPCGPLLAVLSYIGLISFSLQRCIVYSLTFGLGTLVSPLILIALGAGFIPKLLLSRPKSYRVLRIFCGLIIVFFGAQLIYRAF